MNAIKYVLIRRMKMTHRDVLLVVAFLLGGFLLGRMQLNCMYTFAESANWRVNSVKKYV